MNFRHLVFVGLCAVLGPLAARAQTTATLTTSTATLNPAGGRVTFTFGVTFDGTAGYGVTVNLPSTWSYVSGTTEPSIRPSAGQTGSLDWATLNPVTNAAGFTFTAAYPAGLNTVSVSSSFILRPSTGSAVTLVPATVVFASAPVITTQPGGQSVTAGITATLNVAATGTAPLTYQWTKDGSALAGATSATLALANFQSANAGTYAVVVTNTAGSATSANAVLTLASTGGGGGGGGITPVAPTITGQPTSATVTAGATVNFSVSATGTAPLTYQWRKSATPIFGATSATLTLDAVALFDAGTYSVVVTNAAGAATSTAATLAVNPASVAPAITAAPGAVTVDDGQLASFSVTAAGTAPLTYQWQKNGTALAGATSATFSLARAAAGDAGIYSVTVTNTLGSITSAGAALNVRPPTPSGFSGTYFGTFGTGGSFALHVRANLSAVFLGYATNSQTTFVARDVAVDAAGRVRFTVTITTASAERTAAGAQDYAIDATISTTGALTGSVTTTGTAPNSLTATRSAATGTSQSVAGFYAAGAANSAATSYAIVSPAGQAFVLAVSPTATEAGTGTVDATGRLAVTTPSGASVTGALTAATSTLTANLTTSTGAKTDFVGGSDTRVAAEKLLNIATRGAVGGAAGDMIAGFVIRGDAPKLVLIRAVGPGLATFGVAGALAAPRLELFNANSVSLGVNTGWASVTDIASAAVRAGAFALAAGSKDAALLVSLPPAAYTAVVSGNAGGAGVALVEVYDVSENATSAQKVVNLASRGAAGSGDNTLTAGFVISGTLPKRVLIRGVGPTLGGFGVAGTLADPQLALFTQGGAVIATNDNWSTPVTASAADAAQLAAAAAAVGAFAYTPASKDAALLLNLAPGPYTVQVGGVANTTGAALVEVYEVP